MENTDDEAQRLEQLRHEKRKMLDVLDSQARQFGLFVPAYIQIERERLRRELGLVESVIASPLTAAIGDELSEGGRFVAYLEQMRKGERATLEAVARVAETFSEELATLRREVFTRLDQSERASMQWRRWGTWALVIIIVVVVLMAIVGSFWLGRLADGRSIVRDLIGLVWR